MTGQSDIPPSHPDIAFPRFCGQVIAYLIDAPVHFSSRNSYPPFNFWTAAQRFTGYAELREITRHQARMV